MTRQMRNKMRTVFIAFIAVMLQWSFEVHAGTQCFGNCDSYVNYYCDPSEDNCEPCLHEGDAPKCKEYFESLKKPPTSDTPKDTPLTTPIPSHQINDTVRLGDSKPASPVKPKETDTNDKQRHQLTGQEGLTTLPGNTKKKEKHTNVTIIGVTLGMLGSAVTLCVIGAVVRRHLRKKDGTNPTAAMTSSDGRVDLLQVVVAGDQSNGAASKGPEQVTEETTMW